MRAVRPGYFAYTSSVARAPKSALCDCKSGRMVPCISYNLEKEGYEVATVSNGLNAISEIERLMPSVILLDWMLPEISGVEICKLVRSKPDIKNIPIIMLTA